MDALIDHVPNGSIDTQSSFTADPPAVFTLPKGFLSS
jgi:hypothetical protein